jgi:membrane protein implicated in regulation of membrane protease activity
MLDFFRGLGDWNWLIAGVVLLGLEVFVPGNVFVWFGVAAIITGAVAWLAALGWQIDLIVFVVLSVVLVLVGRRLFGRGNDPGEQPFLNDRTHRIVGSVYVLGEPIIDGKGRVKIDDTRWRITGPDMPSGSRVRVIGADGPVLTVVRAD